MWAERVRGGRGALVELLLIELHALGLLGEFVLYASLDGVGACATSPTVVKIMV